MLSRRTLLGGLGAVAATPLGACGRALGDRELRAPGRLIGVDAARGHRLREAAAQPVAGRLECDTVIVGAGVAGLSAAAALDAARCRDYLLLELGDEAGGNAAAGANAVSSFPWGAHYVPVVDPVDEPLVRLFGRLGVIRSVRDDGLPVYDEEALCSEPDERLWRAGIWQDGFAPTVGVSATDRAQTRRFLDEVARLRAHDGADGRPAFALPLARSSEDPALTGLDSRSFASYLDAAGYTAAPLRWYLDYCCRDDYGAPADVVSAWAGLHYFAARRGRAANATHADVVTWPEGNAFLARALAADVGDRLRTGFVARGLRRGAGQVVVTVDDVRANRRLEVAARAAVLCVPRHVLERLDPPATGDAPAAVHYPWVVANITLSRRPRGIGTALAWDNVKYGSPLLGYVVADHQSLGRPREDVVITYYWPLSDRPPAQARQWAAARTQADWCADFLAELLWLHPELRGHVEQVDVRVWGHGMICPVPGYCAPAARAARLRAAPPVFTAHTDLSGISVFEEAYALGQRAAAGRLAWRG